MTAMCYRQRGDGPVGERLGLPIDGELGDEGQDGGTDQLRVAKRPIGGWRD